MKMGLTKVVGRKVDRVVVVVNLLVDDRWRREKRRERVVSMEVAPASYTSAKSTVVIRVREAAFRARPKEEARFAKSTAFRDGWPERPPSAPCLLLSAGTRGTDGALEGGRSGHSRVLCPAIACDAPGNRQPDLPVRSSA